MKKLLFTFVLTLLPLIASAHDIEVYTADGNTIYYNCINNGTELEVTFCGDTYGSYSNEYQGNVVIPEEVTYWNITRKVTSIGESAFRGCSGLTSVTIPNSVTSIGNSAFSGCSGLTSITIPNSVTGIGDGAFSGCSGLSSVEFHCAQIGSWFSGMTSIEEVVIGNEVTSIGYQAFKGCTSLTSVTIGSGVTSIGNQAFYGCSGLTSVTIPNSVTSIGARAFEGCSGLTSVTIPNSVTSIGYQAFEGCSSLTSITIPNSVTSIGDYAFRDCSSLQKVIVPDIAAWCGIYFVNYESNPLYYAHHIYSDENTEIKDLVIPNSVTSIGRGAFRYCSDLTSVTIGNSVTSIGASAFSGCSGLTSVYSMIENVFTINYNTFDTNTYSNAKLYVPIGKKAVYKGTEPWKQFTNIEEYDYSTGIAAPQMGKDVKVVDAYQLHGMKRNGVQRGLNIIRMSDGTTRKVVVK